MSGFDYADAAIPVRSDLGAAHDRAWQRLARPGAWWSGPERVALAAAVRRAPSCPLCAKRREALSPLSVQGSHDGDGGLPEAATEVVHQVRNDPGRLSKAWFDHVMAQGLSEGQYVEAIGVVVTVVSIDSFCRGIGVVPRPLPEPQPGEPSGYRPAGAQPGEAWLPMVSEKLAVGPEADLYGGRPRTGNVIKALSLVPDEVRGLLDLSEAHYLTPQQMMDLTRGRSLDRGQIELVAGRVSALNECFY